MRETTAPATAVTKGAVKVNRFVFQLGGPRLLMTCISIKTIPKIDNTPVKIAVFNAGMPAFSQLSAARMPKGTPTLPS
ncbi:MAG: hypothetical protein WBD24_06900, partial [Candidatus Omnitrophota bacterium]